MARKKVARRKKAAAKKKNPATALKERLAKLSADLKAVKAEVSDVTKRTKALEKANVVKAAPAKKKAATKKRAKKRRTTRTKRK